MPLGRGDQGGRDQAGGVRGGRRGLTAAACCCAALLCATAAVGCGTTAKHAATTTTDVSPSPCKLTDRTRAQLARARRDLATLRAVARRQKRYTDLGTLAMQHASDRYLEDLLDSSLDPWRVNRMIDFGASAVGGVCGHCFQEFENNRPIPQMKYNPHC